MVKGILKWSNSKLEKLNKENQQQTFEKKKIMHKVSFTEV